MTSLGHLRAQETPAIVPKPAAEEAIRANVAAFVKAFNAADSNAIAKLFASEAQMVDEQGTTTQGREAIANAFNSIFAESPHAKMEVRVEGIRFIGSALAIERGVTSVVRKSQQAPDVSRYTAVHVKSKDGPWLMAFVRDEPSSLEMNSQRLKSLEWLIGEWIDESHESVVVSSYRWTANKNFIIAEIKIRRQGQDAMDLSQRIGWDPLTKRIKSWLFDSNGGYGEAYWTQDGNRWILKTTAVKHDGTTASATNTYTRTGKDAYIWQSTDRIVGGEVEPPVEVKIVRKPPEPRLAK